MMKRKKINISELMKKLHKLHERGLFEPMDWLLAIIYAFGGRAPSRVHIQKALFIASRKIRGLEDILGFQEYRKGPWSEEINDVLDNAIASNLIEPQYKQLVLTIEGRRRAERVWKKLGDEERRILAEAAELLKEMTEEEVLLYIYTLYGFHQKSDVYDQLIQKRRELAAKMLKKGVISTSLAAKIAGMSLLDFIAYLRRKGIKPFTAEVTDIEEAEKI